MLINVYCTLRDLPPLTFPHALKGRRDLEDAWVHSPVITEY